MNKKVSDYLAEFLKAKNIKHVFGIVGAGNAHLFDAIYRLRFTEIICVHHEQAAVMAATTYYRTTGKIFRMAQRSAGYKFKRPTLARRAYEQRRFKNLL